MRINRGQLIKSILISKGYTNSKEIAQKAGISESLIEHIFLGRRTSKESLQKLSKLIGQDITYLDGDYHYGDDYKL